MEPSTLLTHEGPKTCSQSSRSSVWRMRLSNGSGAGSASDRLASMLA